MRTTKQADNIIINQDNNDDEGWDYIFLSRAILTSDHYLANEARYQKRIQMFKNKEYDLLRVEKKKTKNSEIKINGFWIDYNTRILGITVIVDGKRCFYGLENVIRHGYKEHSRRGGLLKSGPAAYSALANSPELKKVLRKCIQDEEQRKSLPNSEIAKSAYVPPPVVFLENELLQLTDEQQKVSDDDKILILGCPTSGKTSSLLYYLRNRLKELIVLELNGNDTHDIYIITKSLHLSLWLKTECNKIMTDLVEELEDKVAQEILEKIRTKLKTLTFNDFIRKFYQNIVTVNDCKEWITANVSNKLFTTSKNVNIQKLFKTHYSALFNTDTLYEEFKIIAAYNLEDYRALESRQSFIPLPEDKEETELLNLGLNIRNYLWNRHQAYLKKLGQTAVHPAFVTTLPKGIMPFEFVIDEVTDFERASLKLIISSCITPDGKVNCKLFGDQHQNVFGTHSPVPYIKKLIHELTGINVEPLYLSESHGMSLAAIELANKILDLKIKYFGGVSAKGEYTEITYSPETKKGHADWIIMEEDKSSHDPFEKYSKYIKNDDVNEKEDKEEKDTLDIKEDPNSKSQKTESKVEEKDNSEIKDDPNFQHSIETESKVHLDPKSDPDDSKSPAHPLQQLQEKIKNNPGAYLIIINSEVASYRDKVQKLFPHALVLTAQQSKGLHPPHTVIFEPFEMEEKLYTDYLKKVNKQVQDLMNQDTPVNKTRMDELPPPVLERLYVIATRTTGSYTIIATKKGAIRNILEYLRPKQEILEEKVEEVVTEEEKYKNFKNMIIDLIKDPATRENAKSFFEKNNQKFKDQFIQPNMNYEAYIKYIGVEYKTEAPVLDMAEDIPITKINPNIVKVINNQNNNTSNRNKKNTNKKQPNKLRNSRQPLTTITKNITKTPIAQTKIDKKNPFLQEIISGELTDIKIRDLLTQPNLLELMFTIKVGNKINLLEYLLDDPIKKDKLFAVMMQRSVGGPLGILNLLKNPKQVVFTPNQTNLIPQTFIFNQNQINLIQEGQKKIIENLEFPSQFLKVYNVALPTLREDRYIVDIIQDDKRYRALTLKEKINYAVEFDCVTLIDIFLQYNQIPSDPNSIYNLLIQCFDNKSSSLINYLLKIKFADMKFNDLERNHSILKKAISYNDANIITLLLDHKFDPSQVDEDGNNALHIAAGYGYADLINCFKSVKGYSQNNMKNTPLHIAVAKHNVKFVKALLKNGETILGIRNEMGQTALDVTESCIQSFAEHDADEETLNAYKEIREVLNQHRIKEKQFLRNMTLKGKLSNISLEIIFKHFQGFYFLYEVVIDDDNKFNFLETILESEPNRQILHNYLKTHPHHLFPLLILEEANDDKNLSKKCNGINNRIISLFTKKEIMHLIELNISDSNTLSAEMQNIVSNRLSNHDLFNKLSFFKKIKLAMKLNCKNVFSRIMKIGGSELSNTELLTLLERAINKNSIDMVKIILHEKINFKEKSAGLFPLHWALKNNHTDIAQLLLATNINICELDGKVTPLHIAARLGQLDIIKQIIKKNPDALNIQTPEEEGQCSPLHVAVTYCQKEAVKLLLSCNKLAYSKTDITKCKFSNYAKDNPAMTAFEIENKPEIMEILCHVENVKESTMLNATDAQQRYLKHVLIDELNFIANIKNIITNSLAYHFLFEVEIQNKNVFEFIFSMSKGRYQQSFIQCLSELNMKTSKQLYLFDLISKLPKENKLQLQVDIYEKFSLGELLNLFEILASAAAAVELKDMDSMIRQINILLLHEPRLKKLSNNNTNLYEVISCCIEFNYSMATSYFLFPFAQYEDNQNVGKRFMELLNKAVASGKKACVEAFLMPKYANYYLNSISAFNNLIQYTSGTEIYVILSTYKAEFLTPQLPANDPNRFFQTTAVPIENQSNTKSQKPDASTVAKKPASNNFT